MIRVKNVFIPLLLIFVDFPMCSKIVKFGWSVQCQNWPENKCMMTGYKQSTYT